MRQRLHDDGADRDLRERGWARLPPIEADTLEASRALATTVLHVLAHRAGAAEGFDQLWQVEDRAFRDRVEASLRAILAPWVARAFVGVRAVAFNVFAKRAGGGAVPFHADMSFVDDRGDDDALQVWVPLLDLRRDLGALMLVAGSRESVSPLRPFDWQHPLGGRALDAPPSGATTLETSAGEGVVFAGRTVHASFPNLGTGDRLAVGALLVPAEAALLHVVRRADDARELWSFSDDALRTLVPGRAPAGATLVEVVAPSA
jgi:hypothetical protein